MAKIISKKDLNKKVTEFLGEIKREVEDDYLVIKVNNGKITVQSLNQYLEGKKK